MSRAEKPHHDAEGFKHALDRNMDTEALKRKFDFSHFDLNAVLRGMQLTVVGAHRALQNPEIFTNEHYRQAALAIIIGLGIRLVVAIPILVVKVLLWTISLVYPLDAVTWDDAILDGLNFVGESVLQVPFFLMTLMRHIAPTLDNLFMQSLQWVDMTYIRKHKHDNPQSLRGLYYPNLQLYPSTSQKTSTKSTGGGLGAFIARFLRKGTVSLAVFALSFLPIVGNFVLPAASFYTFRKAVGLGPASIIFGVGFFLPRQYLVMFLQSYFSSRSLMRELLEPYFTRVRFTKEEKRNWFRNREGVLFGFGLGFYILVKVPLFGVLIYGIAEASTAYLITKVTDPPPNPSTMREYASSQQVWRNKHEFLSLSWTSLDSIHHESSMQGS